MDLIQEFDGIGSVSAGQMKSKQYDGDVPPQRGAVIGFKPLRHGTSGPSPSSDQ
ncbi:MAG: hypothetical protein IIC73_02535 [Armatimonadetes bacterium]|nr:hypothetical protein [Armatimonadota bacterium]